jgi:uncharacterized protein
MIWCQSLEGGAFNLLAPVPEMISWHTMSIVLGRIPRFGGHTLQGTYSVAQHCVEGARAIIRDTGRRDWAAAFLLHDAHEAYIGDLTTPVQKAIGALVMEEQCCENDFDLVNYAIKELKWRIDCAVYAKAELSFYWVHPEAAAIIKEYDRRMAATERRERMADCQMPWNKSIEDRKPLEGCDLTPWSADLATALYRGAMRELIPNVGGQIDLPAPIEGCDCEPCAETDIAWPLNCC